MQSSNNNQKNTFRAIVLGTIDVMLIISFLVAVFEAYSQGNINSSTSFLLSTSLALFSSVMSYVGFEHGYKTAEKVNKNE